MTSCEVLFVVSETFSTSLANKMSGLKSCLLLLDPKMVLSQ